MQFGQYQSWGLTPKANPARVIKEDWRFTPLPAEPPDGQHYLAYGNGRSYGDVALNNGGTILDTGTLNRLIKFDRETGVIRCEAGVLLSEILQLCVPAGWFVPATPGTRFITIGGAIANDVHGKNHHQQGSFGCHLNSLELLRSDGSRLHCSADENSELYCATIGGLGLTGLIIWAEIQLIAIDGDQVEYQELPFSSFTEFLSLSRESAENWPYTVSWIDCSGTGKKLGRGIFSRGRHAPGLSPKQSSSAAKLPLSVPFTPPISLINHLSVSCFNKLYYYWHSRHSKMGKSHYESFFFPLDSIRNWNRIYGRHGFYQYQCVIPHQYAETAIPELLHCIGAEKAGSFLAVLKEFGEQRSLGMLSFPRPGLTLAMDFPNTGKKTLALLDRLDSIVRAAGGAVYPAKDARMSAEAFSEYFPLADRFSTFIDPHFSSSFWRRVRP